MRINELFQDFLKCEIIIFWKIYKRMSLSIRTRDWENLKRNAKIFANRSDRKFMDKIIFQFKFDLMNFE